MATTLTIRDEEMSGKTIHEFSLEFLTEQITVRELIRSRVYQEVSEYNARRNSKEVFQGLVQPPDAEKTPEGFLLRKGRTVDWKAQFDRAVEAFEANQILILVNDRQVESLDDVIEVGPQTEVSFLRLTMLVGG